MATALRRTRQAKGAWYRHGKDLWTVTDCGRQITLRHDDGTPIKGKNNRKAADLAYAHWLTNRDQEKKNPRKNIVDTVTVEKVVCDFLIWCAAHRSEKTYEMRKRYLFDFVFGYSVIWKDKEPELRPRSARIHDGYGNLAVGELTLDHIKDWIRKHADWGKNAESGFCRNAIVSLNACFNWAAEENRALIVENPIYRCKREAAANGKPAKLPKTKDRSRVTFFKPNIQEAFPEFTTPEHAAALNILIKTGMRYGCEFCAVTSNHLHERNGILTIEFEKKESKTRKHARTVFLLPEIEAIVRRCAAAVPKGTPIFRNSDGTPWKGPALKEAFYRMRDKMIEAGFKFDPDDCPYTTRHTFAKMMLVGAWGCHPVSIPYLAQMMGNTKEVCLKHYADWPKEMDDRIHQFMRGVDPSKKSIGDE